jgi:hypothetical protein
VRPGTYFLIALLMAPATSVGADNERLRAIVQADQAERENEWKPEDFQSILQRDAERRAEVQSELSSGRVLTSSDYFNAALVMQHGQGLEDIRMAHALATISASLDPSNRSAKWLKAASWDRMMSTQKKPQWYGTQYVRDGAGKWALYAVDETAVTDEDRTALGAPSLAEAKKRVEIMNGGK